MTPARPHLALLRLPVRTGAQGDAPGRLAAGYVGRLAAFGGLWIGVVLWLPLGMWLAHGTDAYSYWAAWRNGLYTAGHSDVTQITSAYLYSPLFAQVIWPLTLLPFPVFYALLAGAAEAVYAWLLAPVAFRIRLPLLVALAPVALVGNIEWLLALAAVVSMRSPASWAIAVLTKATVGVAGLWHVGSGQWRQIVSGLVIVLPLVGLSVLLTPGLWQEWLRLLATNAHQHPGGTVVFLGQMPAWTLPARICAAGLLAFMSGRSHRLWLIAPALVLAQPDIWPGTFGVLAAVPRLRSR